MAFSENNGGGGGQTYRWGLAPVIGKAFEHNCGLT